jgi:RimJ/RimL family protein N-acetyltransferase
MIVAETKRLLIRRPLLNDFDALLDLYADPEAAKMLGAAPSAEAVRRLLMESTAAFERDGSGLLTVIDHHRGEVVGQCGVQRVELEGVRREAMKLFTRPG